MNYTKLKSSQIFKIICLVLIQAFLVMDIAFAAGGEFCVVGDTAKADTLAPGLQIDAQALKGVFSDFLADSNKRSELINGAEQKKSKAKNPFSLASAVRNVVLTAILFIVIALPFAKPAFSNTVQARAPPAIVQTLPADMRQLSGNKQALLKAIAKSNKIKKPGKEQKQTIATGISKKGLVFTNALARERVKRINNWIERQWNKLSKSGQLDEYTAKTIGSPAGDAVAKMKLLVHLANPDTYKILKSTNTAVYIGDIPGAAYTTGARVSGSMGRPLVYINKKLTENVFWGAFALNHEAIHAGDIPQNVFGLAWKYNTFTLIRALIFSVSDPAEKKAYEAEAEFTSKFGIVPERGNRFVDEFDLVGPYYEQRWNSMGYHLIGAFVFNFLPFIFGISIIKYLIGRRDAGSQYPGLRNSSRNSFRNDKRLIRKNRRRGRGNRFRSIILLPFLAFQLLALNADFTQAAGLNQAAAASPGIISTGVGIGLVIGVVLISVSLIGILGWMISQRRKKESSFYLFKNSSEPSEVTKFSGQMVEGNIKELPVTRERNSQQVPEKEEAEDTQASLRDKFADGQLDAVIFIDVDLMRLTNQYVAKQNVNALLDVVENELQSIINELGQENALSLRRGGDEFVLALNSRGNKQTAIDIANRLKKNVENTRFSVASIGSDKPSDDVIETIETLGGRIDVIGRQYIVIIPQKAGGLRGRARAEEFIEQVNTITQLLSAAPQEAKGILSIKRSWLDRKAVSNEVSFTLSIGVAHSSEAKDAAGDNLYDQTHNLAAHRKDSSKETFKETGNGHIESEASFGKRVSGESILTSEEARKDLEEFNKLQYYSHRLEKDGINTGLRTENVSDVLYFSTQDAARANLNNRMRKGELAHAIAFSLQGLGYYDENGRIDEYKRAYYNAPAAVKDNRIDILDFKVVNEAHGYVAGDEVIGRMRIAAIKFAGLFEGFEVIFVRGPPAGPIGFLVPKTKQASNIAAVSVQALFDKYMDEVGNYFNRKQDTLVKIGHLRVIWDNISPADKHIGEVLERISKARAVYEYTHNSGQGINHAYKYTESINESWQVMEEEYAAEAVEQLENLKRQWQINASDSDLKNDPAEDDPVFKRVFNDLADTQVILQSI